MVALGRRKSEIRPRTLRDRFGGAPTYKTRMCMQRRRLRSSLLHSARHASVQEAFLGRAAEWTHHAHVPTLAEAARPRGRPLSLGVLEVDDVQLVGVGAITDEDATRAGFGSRAELVAHLQELGELEPDTMLYRVELHHGGDGDRVELALEDQLTDADIQAIRTKLAKMDAKEPWTADTLAIIAARPRVVAKELAAALGRETLPFKTDVRKLKKLGLTQSFEVGYEISPRGRAFLSAIASKSRTRR